MMLALLSEVLETTMILLKNV